MPSENFAEIFFDRALNRPRSPEVRKPLACFLVLFARRKKNVKTSLFRGVPRFSKPLFSSSQQQLPTDKLKSFCRSAASFGGYAAFFCCLRQPIAALGGYFFRLTAVSDAQKLATGNFFARPSNIFSCRLRGRIATPFKAAP